MPTFTAIALDRLLEPGAAREKPTTEPTHVKSEKEVTVWLEDRNDYMNGNVAKKVVQKKYHWTQISPALYTTPEATPIPDTQSLDTSDTSSPYIINHKRRKASLAKGSSKETLNEVLHVQTTHTGSVDVTTEVYTVEKGVTVPDGDTHLVFNKNADELLDEKIEGAAVLSNGVVGQISPQSILMLYTARDGENDNLFDPCDSLSCSSYSDAEDSPCFESSIKFASSAGEFYDAPEELSSDGGASKPLQSPGCDIESELRGMKLPLLEEIEQRKQAENALQQWQCQWLKLREQLSSVGITLPADFPLYLAENCLDVCEQINVARFVSEAVGRGIAKAEAERQMEAQLELKRFEISRLNDRLHYYEAVNHEMSQRNQEVMESARRLRQQKNQRQRWVWGSIATSITLGIAALAWTYLPADKGMVSSICQEIPKESDNSGN